MTIDWENGRILVRSPKTAHHAGHESRLIPLFPEIRPHLEAVFDAAEPGTVHVIANHRHTGSNMRTQITRFILTAGLKPWPKLFNNLRQTRATELAGDYPGHVAAEWMGHSERVAFKHYRRVRDSDFEKALQNALQQTAIPSETERSEQSEQAENSAELRSVAPSV